MLSNDSNTINLYFQKNYEGKLGYELPDTEEELFKINSLLIIDVDSFQTIISQDNWEPMLSQFLQCFLDSLPEDRAQLNAAYNEHNWQRLEKMAHKIKGGCVCIGLQKLAIASQFLERYIKVGHSAQIENLYQQMIRVMDETVSEVEKWLIVHC